MIQPQASSSAATTSRGIFPGFPTVGQSASTICPVFQTASVQTGKQNNDKLRRLRPPTSAANVIEQEDVNDIAGFY